MSLFLSLSTGSLFWRIIIRRPHLSAEYSSFHINCYNISSTHAPTFFWHCEWQLWSHWQVEIQAPATRILSRWHVYTPGPPVDWIRSGLQPQKLVDQRNFFQIFITNIFFEYQFINSPPVPFCSVHTQPRNRPHAKRENVCAWRWLFLNANRQ